jgi:hypothetical protein
MFGLKCGKRELQIEDALLRREKEISLNKKKYVLKELLFGDMVKVFSIFESLHNSKKSLSMFVSENIAVIILLCFKNENIDINKLTMRESLNFVLAFIEVNDLDRIFSNFQKAMPSVVQIITASATLPKS